MLRWLYWFSIEIVTSLAPAGAELGLWLRLTKSFKSVRYRAPMHIKHNSSSTMQQVSIDDVGLADLTKRRSIWNYNEN